MKNINSTTILFLLLCLLFVTACKKDKDEPPVESGTIGKLTWALSSGGTLTISGKGEMPNYDSNPLNTPWPNEIITDVIIKKGVTSIGDGAFNLCTGLTSIAIPNSVTSIGNYAFAYCISLTSIAIPNSVTYIGNIAFANCISLTSIIIPNSVTNIESGTFSGCIGLTSVIIPNSVTTIGGSTFSGCTGLTFITIPNSVTSIENGTFIGCTGLTSVTIPNSVTSIEIGAFALCNALTSVDVDNGNITYCSEDGVLFNKTKTILIKYPAGKTDAHYAISNSVTDIGDGAFFGCRGLTSIIIPNSVTSIESSTFSECTGLTEITIPNSVTHIWFETFKGCSSLTEVINESVIPQVIQADVFSHVDLSACTLRVPEVSLNAYRTAEGWKDFGNIVAI